MAAFQSASSSCAIDALAIVCKRSGTPANIVLHANEEEDANQTYMLILGGEANRGDLDSISSLAVLWAAVVKVARTIDIGPPSDSLPDFSSLGSDEGRFFGAFLTSFEVLMENRPADGAYLVRSMVETFVSSHALANADKILLQLVREYKDHFPFAYTFNRRANKHPKSSFDAVEKHFRTTRSNKPANPSGAASAEDDVSMMEDGLEDDDDDGDDDTLSSSFPMENFPAIAAPSIAPLKPYSISTDRDGSSSSDRNYDYSPHQASIVNAYYNNPTGEGEAMHNAGGYSRYMHSLEEDEDSDIDNSALYLQQIQLRKSKKKMTRMKKKKASRANISAASSLDSIVTAEVSPASMARGKSVTFNDENNEVVEISALDGTPPSSPRAVTAVTASVSSASSTGGAQTRQLYTSREREARTQPSRPEREDDVEDFVSDEEHSSIMHEREEGRGRGLGRADIPETAGEREDRTNWRDRSRSTSAAMSTKPLSSASSYKPFRLNSVTSGQAVQHSKLSDSESSLELSDKEKDRREEGRTGRRPLHSVLSDDDDEKEEEEGKQREEAEEERREKERGRDKDANQWKREGSRRGTDDDRRERADPRNRERESSQIREAHDLPKEEVPSRYRYSTAQSIDEPLESISSEVLSTELVDSMQSTSLPVADSLSTSLHAVEEEPSRSREEPSSVVLSPIQRSHNQSVSLSVSSLTMDGGGGGGGGTDRAAAIERVKQNIAKMKMLKQQLRGQEGPLLDASSSSSMAKHPTPDRNSATRAAEDPLALPPAPLFVNISPSLEGMTARFAVDRHLKQHGEEKEEEEKEKKEEEEEKERGLPWEETDDELCEPPPQTRRDIPSLSTNHLEALCPLSQHRASIGMDASEESPLSQVAPPALQVPPPRKVISWDSTRALLPISETPPATRFSFASRSSTSSPHFPLAPPLEEDPIVVMRSLSQPPTLPLAQSYSRYSLREAPLTNVHLARLADLSDLAQEVGVIMEASVHKQSDFMKMWQKRFMVLRESEENFCELCFYKQSVPSAWGNVPLRLKACIPILDIAAIETVDTKSAQGKEFVVRFVSKQAPQSRPLSFAFWRKSSSLNASNLKGLSGSSTSPLGGSSRGDEDDARSDHSGSAASDKHYGTKIPFLYLQAEDAEMRLLWVTMLNKVLRLAHDACQ